MASVSAIRDGLQVAIDTIDGLRVYDTVPDDVQPPAAVVVPSGGTFGATMARGSDDMVFEVRVAVSAAVSRTGQDTLDALMAGSGPRSIKAAVEADASLDGVCHFAHVAGWDDYGEVTIAGVVYFGVTFSVEVTASGT